MACRARPALAALVGAGDGMAQRARLRAAAHCFAALWRREARLQKAIGSVF